MNQLIFFVNLLMSEEPPTKRQCIDPATDNNDIQEINSLREKGQAAEEKRGIRSYLGNRDDWFSGIVKLRFEDFLVYEVDLDKNVARITSTEPLDISSFGNADTKNTDPKDVIVPLIGEEKTEELL